MDHDNIDDEENGVGGVPDADNHSNDENSEDIVEGTSENNEDEFTENSIENNTEEFTEKETNEEPEEDVADDRVKKVSGMYQDWFLDYASYVILERAIPDSYDGFKPVQRRIMHSLKELDDGRYNKVANLVGNTMKYHPHGDASIGDALVQLGQKELLIDMQGNWGNVLTGDRAAAPRYIEARLSKFAIDVLFNPKITEWQSSYDGRNNEPVHLPVKFPLLLAHGVEGIAVGLSTKIMPHNFNELIDASIKHLKGKKFDVLPDFLTGGIADFTNYNEGLRGGKVRVRSRIEIEDKKTLIIKEVPFGTTTSSLIDSILKANDRGKIKIRNVEDNTAEYVEIVVHLPNNISPDKTIDALYAFTDCEVSISPLSCIIENDTPIFIGVNEILKNSTEKTVELLTKELEIQLGELNESWHMASLERIFIENRVYLVIENEETWEGVISAIHLGLKPHIAHLKRNVTDEDVVRLTEIKIKRISKFDLNKAQLYIDSVEDKIEKTQHHLDNIIDFTIDYFSNLKKKYGKGKERKTEIRLFDDIVATKVVIRSEKLYVNREDGFVGINLRKDEFVDDCADIDDVIVIRNNGKMTISKVSQKAFFGKDIIHVAVFKKKDKRTVYNVIYFDGVTNMSLAKRFNVTSITRDKEYDITAGAKGSKLLYFSANPNGEAEVVSVILKGKQKDSSLMYDLDFANVDIKGRAVKGKTVSKIPVKKIELKEEGISTLAPRKIWYDESVRRLNVEDRGRLLGDFSGEDKLMVITKHGTIKLISYDLNTHFDSEMMILEKWIPKQPISVIYYEGAKKKYYLKRFFYDRFEKEETFIGESKGSFLLKITFDYRPVFEFEFVKYKTKAHLDNRVINVEDFVAVKGYKALGNQIASSKIKKITDKESLPYTPPEIKEQDGDKDEDGDQTILEI
ncbi:MAG: DNA gyrase/topoisomerase IV subunit A [Ichthyobacteriaceae bacterium]|nr:DNA gyrase/topoisomerase IV subunit A [Ichthyobacteriaceae bacterium]